MKCEVYNLVSQMSLDSKIESKSSNNTYLNIIEFYIMKNVNNNLQDVFVYKAGAFTYFFRT